jgi:hypothetical protein
MESLRDIVYAFGRGLGFGNRNRKKDNTGSTAGRLDSLYYYILVYLRAATILKLPPVIG